MTSELLDGRPRRRSATRADRAPIRERVETGAENHVLIDPGGKRRLDEILNEARSHRRPAAEAHQLSVRDSRTQRLQHLSPIYSGKVPSEPVADHMRRRPTSVRRSPNRRQNSRPTRASERGTGHPPILSVHPPTPRASTLACASALPLDEALAVVADDSNWNWETAETWYGVITTASGENEHLVEKEAHDRAT